jgi:hypothetical protein
MRGKRDMYLKNIASKPMDKLEQAKIIFQFILMVLCSLIIGAMLSSICSEEYYISSQFQISAHFEKMFLGISELPDALLEILRYSLTDIVVILLVFLVSFSIVNYVATDILLIVCGIRCGFLITFLSGYLNDTPFIYNTDILDFSIFTFFKLSVLLLVLCYSYHAAICASYMKYKNENGRVSVYFSKFISFVAITVAYVGALIIINAAYCLLIYILK